MHSFEFIPAKEENLALEKHQDKPIEQIREELDGSMSSIAEQVNSTFQVKDFIDNKCAINIERYGLSKDEKKQYYNDIKARQRYFYSRDHRSIPIKDIKQPDLDRWLTAQEHRKSELVEKLTTLILHKGLGPDYIVVRTCKGDDYNGIDNIIVHKPSGTVVCAFDDFHSGFSDDSEDKKLNYIKGASKNGGVPIKYGFTVKEGRLVTKSFNNVPIFYLAFNVTELDEALQNIDTKDPHSLSASDEPYYDKIIEAFSRQISIIEEQAVLGKYPSKIFMQNIQKFKALLPSMKRIDTNFEQEGSMPLAA
ncbi:hypothetical protein IPN41_02395 [Candidatus Falkowbacteria bacterium]|nr:MAG: hypothetical protein IPN41_02395 [Candidatus Falkowbacteria bacterium]